MKNRTSLAARVWRALDRYWLVAAVLVAAIALPHVPSSIPLLGLGFAGMIIDTSLQFCNATALSTAGTGLALVGNVIDLTTARDIAAGRPLYLVISVTQAATSAGAPTIQLQLASDSIAAIHTDGSANQHWESETVLKAAFIPGLQFIVPLPLEFPNYGEFLGILQNIGVAALTAGAITAELVLDPPLPKTYPQSARITL